jgi:hypothetical protein
MEVQESEDLIRESKEVLNEVAAIDFMTATRLADNEYRKLLALSKSKEEGRLAGLKVAKAFLSKRKAQEQDAGQKNIYTQKISHIDLDIAKLNVILKRAPKKPAKPGATTPKPATPIIILYLLIFFLIIFILWTPTLNQITPFRKTTNTFTMITHKLSFLELFKGLVHFFKCLVHLLTKNI